MNQQPARHSKLPVWLVVACSVIYVAGALWSTRQLSGLPPDSYDYAEVARSLVRGDGFTINRIIFHTGLFETIRHPLEVHGLLQPVLIAPLFWLWGPESVLVRIPSVLFGGCLVLATFITARRLFGTLAAAFAAALIFTNYNLLFWAVLGADDIGHALFVLASISCFVLAVETGARKWLFLAGLGAALASLAKFSGMVLPAVFSATLLISLKARRAVGLRGWLLLVLPLAPVLALYVLRNYSVYGTPGSPYGGIEWLGKNSFPAYFGFYADPPTPAEVWAQLGQKRVIELLGQQLTLLQVTALAEPILPLGLLAVVWLLRRHTLYAACTLLYTAALLLLVCVLHHVEARYLSALLPLYSVAIGVATAAALTWIAGRLPSSRARLRQVGLLALLAGALFMARRSLSTLQDFARTVPSELPCADAVEFVRRHVPSDEVVLTSNSWFVTWATERPSVNAPTNGDAALTTVALHYGVRWGFTGVPVIGALDLQSAVQSEQLKVALRPKLAFDGGQCDVFRLEPGAQARAPDER